MHAENTQPELLNFVTYTAGKLHGTPMGAFLLRWENIIFSLLVAGMLVFFVFMATRKLSRTPGRLQAALEIIVGGLDDFVCGILGPSGRRFVPFIGTIFLYILVMNLIGLVPFFKSPTSSWSVTLALAICVFFFVQYTAIRELGILGYLDHLSGKPRGGLAWSVIMPLFMLALHILGEMIRPLSLSLRLRSNIWGDDVLLAVLAGFGLQGIPLLFFNTVSALIAGMVQAVVFSLLSTIYIALVLPEEEHA